MTGALGALGPAELASVRAAYNAVIGRLLEEQQVDAARECADLAVRQGVWSRPDQRPLVTVDLPGRPLHDAGRHWFARFLEERFEPIRAELDRVVAAGAPAFLPVDEPLLGDGRWDQVVLYEAGQRNGAACEAFPVLADVLAQIPEATTHGPGVVTLSWLHPGARIMPHCGRSNAHLRLHMGLRVPPGPTMRVGGELVTWEEGRCIVFDDSFEHEVHHPGSEPRVVLLMDVLHPDLAPGTRARLLRERRGIEDKIADHLVANDVQRVEVDDGAVRLDVSGVQEAAARRYLAAAGARWAELRDGRLVLGRD